VAYGDVYRTTACLDALIVPAGKVAVLYDCSEESSRLAYVNIAAFRYLSAVI